MRTHLVTTLAHSLGEWLATRVRVCAGERRHEAGGEGKGDQDEEEGGLAG